MSNTNRTNVYSGAQRLATHQDLSNLREEIKRMIAGPLVNDVSANGYIPWKYTEDGTLDVDYLFPELLQEVQEHTGLTITKDGVKISSNVNTLNFSGKYVFFDVDENGNLIIKIQDPLKYTSSFNSVNGTTNGLVKINNEIISDIIIPDTSITNSSLVGNIYGDWLPGSKQECINWNGNEYYDALEITTEESIWAKNTTSFFEIFVYDANNNVKAEFTTKNVEGNTVSEQGLTSDAHVYNYNIRVLISNCEEEQNGGISFKPTFRINLIGLFGQYGSRFHVKIVHHNGSETLNYVSKDYLYNVGKVPVILNPVLYLNMNTLMTEEPPVYYWSSGLKYFVQGDICLLIQEIRNINYLAAVDKKIDYNFDCLRDIHNSSGNFENYNLSVNNICSWSSHVYIKEDLMINYPTNGNLVVKNAYGESENQNMPVNILINSKRNLKLSDNLNEYFNFEDYRVSNKFSSIINDGVISLTKWNSGASLKEYDDGSGLMVIPTSGLMYPFGDWTGYLPSNNPNYSDFTFLSNEKYFSRVFTGNSNLKFGGIFKFEGISKDNFLDSRFSCIISPDQGQNWYSLKDIRNKKILINRDGSSYEATGILTNIKEIENGIEVYWSYPENICSKNPIYFQLGLKPSLDIIIKSISLRNLNNSKEW